MIREGLRWTAAGSPRSEAVLRPIAWSAFVCFVVFGCRCGEDSVLAYAEEIVGGVDRDFAASQNQWEKAAVGADFRVGDGIQSGAGGSAVLALGDGSYAKLAEKTCIRFYALTAEGKKSSRKIEVETGELELTVGSDDFTLETGLGVAKLETGSRVRIRRTDTGTNFAVDIGKAVFSGSDNAAREVGAGQQITLEIGAAVIEKPAEVVQDTATAGAPPDRDTEASTVDSEADSVEKTSRNAQRGRGGNSVIHIPVESTTPDFVVQAGESFTVHVAAPPVAVAFHFGDKCTGEAGVQVGKKWLGRGRQQAALLFEAGRHRYRIVCLDDRGQPSDNDVGRGKILVIRDAGKKRVPNAAPSSFVETDGRSYNILYQTRLPSVTVRWPEAPPGQKYTLNITTDGKARKVPCKSPEIRLPSGDLQEGIHLLKFEASGSFSRTSRSTKINIRYDNAAPTAAITSPSDGSFGPGDRVDIIGEAAPGWSVSVAGGSVSQDAQNRFRGQTAYPGNVRAVAIRVSNKGRGIHYYLRRSRQP